MKYIDKEMSKIDFYGIKYRKIKDVNDYSLLKSEIDHLLKEGDKKQYLISAENSKIKAEYEKDKSMNINLSLAQSLLFCICGYICGYLGGGKTYEILEFIKGFIICFALAFFIVWLIIMRAQVVLNAKNKKIIFYDTICRILKNECK